MINISLKNLGYMCQCFRRSLGYTQKDVANDTGYTEMNISHFERGNNDNAIILLWYIEKGFGIETILDYHGRLK